MSMTHILRNSGRFASFNTALLRRRTMPLLGISFSMSFLCRSFQEKTLFPLFKSILGCETTRLTMRYVRWMKTSSASLIHIFLAINQIRPRFRLKTILIVRSVSLAWWIFWTRGKRLTKKVPLQVKCSILMLFLRLSLITPVTGRK